MQPETLVDHIKFDHGFTSKSPPIIHVSFCSSAVGESIAAETMMIGILFFIIHF